MMPDNGSPAIDFVLKTPYIPLDKLLKVLGVAHSGGVARLMIANGLVYVDGVQELRKAYKVRVGQTVTLEQWRIHIQADMPSNEPVKGVVN